MNKTAEEILKPYAINRGRREVVVFWEDAIKAMEKFASQQPGDELPVIPDAPKYKGTNFTLQPMVDLMNGINKSVNEAMEQPKPIRPSEDDIEKYPLPICFNPEDEKKELHRRSLTIQADQKEWDEKYGEQPAPDEEKEETYTSILEQALNEKRDEIISLQREVERLKEELQDSLTSNEASLNMLDLELSAERKKREELEAAVKEANEKAQKYHCFECGVEMQQNKPYCKKCHSDLKALNP